MSIKSGNKVGFEYTLTLDDGTLVGTNVGEETLVYTHGDGDILPALESALDGLSVDEEMSVSLDADDAYGQLDDEAFQEVPLEQIPKEAHVLGTELTSDEYDGPIRVHELRENTIVLDFNHPLAGKTLNYEIRILLVE